MIIAKKRNYSDAKTKELVLYIANALKDQPAYGATLLNKALYYIDNVSYLKFKKPVSNLKYVKQHYGATPSPSEFLSLWNELIHNKDLEEVKTEFFGKVQKKHLALRSPNIEYFNNEEIMLIDKVIANISNHNATSISNASHKVLAWEIADDMEELPLYSYLLTSKIPTDNDISWAKREIDKLTN